MTGYTFTYGVDGFGADVAPAIEEGVYLNYDKAFQHLVELNSIAIKDSYQTFYEEGYGADYYPETDVILAKLEKEENWDAFETELNKHMLSDIESICKRIMEYDQPPYHMYSMEEIEIHV